uniref:Uncharacterized protein n=1 Tax=Ditylenchus dipsaci TaxID=166011 RepID=A0A915ENW4_9BILA
MDANQHNVSGDDGVGGNDDLVDIDKLLVDLFGSSCTDDTFLPTTQTKADACKLLRKSIYSIFLSAPARKFTSIKDLVSVVAGIVKNGRTAQNAGGTVVERFHRVVSDMRATMMAADDGEQDEDYDKLEDLDEAFAEVKYLERNEDVRAQFIFVLWSVVKDAEDTLPNP